MTLGIVVFGAAFLAGLGLGTYTRRPLSTAFLVLFLPITMAGFFWLGARSRLAAAWKKLSLPYVIR